MEDTAVWIFWIVIIVGSIASSVIKAKKKREEAARRVRQASMQGADPDSDAGSGWDMSHRPVRKSLAEVLEELARQATEQPSSTFAPRPIASSKPATRPMGSFRPATEPEEGEYIFGRRNEYNAEEEYGAGDDRFDAEIASYERLAAERASRTTYMAASAPADHDAAAIVSEEDPQTTIQEILGGEFDLRRAVIEAEILTPKFGR